MIIGKLLYTRALEEDPGSQIAINDLNDLNASNIIELRKALYTLMYDDKATKALLQNSAFTQNRLNDKVFSLAVMLTAMSEKKLHDLIRPLERDGDKKSPELYKDSESLNQQEQVDKAIERTISLLEIIPSKTNSTIEFDIRKKEGYLKNMLGFINKVRKMAEHEIKIADSLDDLDKDAPIIAYYGGKDKVPKREQNKEVLEILNNEKSGFDNYKNLFSEINFLLKNRKELLHKIEQNKKNENSKELIKSLGEFVKNNKEYFDCKERFNSLKEAIAEKKKMRAEVKPFVPLRYCASQKTKACMVALTVATMVTMLAIVTLIGLAMSLPLAVSAGFFGLVTLLPNFRISCALVESISEGIHKFNYNKNKKEIQTYENFFTQEAEQLSANAEYLLTKEFKDNPDKEYEKNTIDAYSTKGNDKAKSEVAAITEKKYTEEPKPKTEEPKPKKPKNRELQKQYNIASHPQPSNVTDNKARPPITYNNFQSSNKDKHTDISSPYNNVVDKEKKGLVTNQKDHKAPAILPKPEKIQNSALNIAKTLGKVDEKTSRLAQKRKENKDLIDSPPIKLKRTSSISLSSKGKDTSTGPQAGTM